MNSSAPPEIKKIKNRQDIKKILENGRKVFTSVGVFFLIENKEDPCFHFAVLIKKSIGNAVKRNYYKRIFRSFVKNNISVFKQYNFVVFLFNKSVKTDYNDLSVELTNRLTVI